MQEAIKDRGSSRGVGEELGPALELNVGRDRDRALFVGGGDEPEQVVGGDAVQGGEAKVVDHDEVVAQEPFDQLPDGVVGEAAVERFDQLIGLKEADFAPGGDCGTAERLGEMALADTGRARETEVVLAIEPLERGEELERRARQRGGLDIEPVERLGCGEPGGLQSSTLIRQYGLTARPARGVERAGSPMVFVG